MRGSAAAAGVGPWVTSPLTGGHVCLYLPQIWCAWSVRGVCVCTHWQNWNLRVGGPQVQDGVSVEWGAHADTPRGSCKCGEPGTCGQLRGPGPGQGCQAGREATLVLEGCANVHVLVDLESVVCARASGFLSLPAPEEEGTWLPVCMFMRVLHL